MLLECFITLNLNISITDGTAFNRRSGKSLKYSFSSVFILEECHKIVFNNVLIYLL
jgi:hypothetical protein